MKTMAGLGFVAVGFLSLHSALAMASEVTTSYDLPNCGGRAFVTQTSRQAWVEVSRAERCSNVRFNGMETKMVRRGELYYFDADLRARDGESLVVEVRSNSGHTWDRIVVSPPESVQPASSTWQNWEEDAGPEDDGHVRIRIRETHVHRPRIVVRQRPVVKIQPVLPRLEPGFRIHYQFTAGTR